MGRPYFNYKGVLIFYSEESMDMGVSLFFQFLKIQMGDLENIFMPLPQNRGGK